MAEPRDAALEAAARALYGAYPQIMAPESKKPEWEDTPPRYRGVWVRLARVALMAADRAAPSTAHAVYEHAAQIAERLTDEETRDVHGTRAVMIATIIADAIRRAANAHETCEPIEPEIANHEEP